MAVAAVEAGDLRREDRADRTGIHASVGVSADLSIDRTDVQAGAAPDASKRLRGEFVREKSRSFPANGLFADHLKRVASRVGCRSGADGVSRAIRHDAVRTVGIDRSTST